ncbi:MAG TPA: methyltransferase domain-containing protein [Chloroflexota bacterium]|nr:methyltransferase domain-containing protein [Chloroflexota bacterium]
MTLDRRAREVEWIDQIGNDPGVLAENLEEIRRINRWLGGSALSLGALDRLLPAGDVEEPVRLLDVGTGAADLPEALDDWLRRRKLRGQVIGVDLSVEVLARGRERLGRRGADIPLAVADGIHLPFGDGAFAVAHCSFLLHHLDPDDAVALLGELRRVSRRGVVVNDLRRGWISYLGSLIVCRVLSRNPLTRHDGPLSARRAYSVPEMAELARRARLTRIRFAGTLGYRVAMIAEAGV